MSDEITSGDEGMRASIEELGDPVDLAHEGSDGVRGTPWSRRTFLKAAALGTAAAAVWQKGPGFTLGPAAAYANDLSGNPCTAGDVTILGGTITNEPCVCTGGTFNAITQFTVRNSTGTGRYCIVLHLVASGGVIAQDVVLRDAGGSSTAPGKDQGSAYRDTVMFGTIVGVPCDAGEICFGQALASDFRGKCAPGTCSTVAWSTTPGDAGCQDPGDQRPPGGQCRHQQICVTGFGITATCADSSCVDRGLSDCGDSVTGCSVACGSSLNVKIVASGHSGGACTGALDLSVKKPGATTFTSIRLNSSGCYVDSSPVAGTYTFKATDCHDCSREATLVVCVSQPTVSLSSDAAIGCVASGNVTFTATAGFETYAFSVGGVVVRAALASNTFAYALNADNVCHTVSVHAVKGNCFADASAHITQCVTSTVASGVCPV